MSELLTCPFCGGEAGVIDYDDECWVAHQCVNGTSVETESYETANEAIAAWNRRTGNAYATVRMPKETQRRIEQMVHEEVAAGLADMGLVRCEDCKSFKESETPHDDERPHFCTLHGIDLADDTGFCAWGERRGE